MFYKVPVKNLHYKWIFYLGIRPEPPKVILSILGLVIF